MSSILRWFEEAGLGQRPAGSPGAGMHYSDTNYVLLGVIAERVTGSSLPDLLARWIFGPLGLDDTYLEFHQPPRGNARLVYPSLGRMWLGDVNTSFDWGGVGWCRPTWTFIESCAGF